MGLIAAKKLFVSECCFHCLEFLDDGTALHYAAELGHTEVVALLYTRGGLDLNAPRSSK